MKKIKIESFWGDGTYLYAYLSNGKRIARKTAYCSDAAYAQLVRDIASITGQTYRGVRQSLRKWVSFD
jgi:hypothetical protein